MELTGLKSFKNAGGSVYSSIGSSDSSKTVGYKYINNLPKFEDGTPGITSNVYSQTTYGMPSVKQYFSSPAATVGAKSISAPIIPSTGSKGGGLNTSLGSKGGGLNVSGIGSVVTSGVQFAGDAINSFSVNETGEDIQQKYGTSQQNVGGIGYESQNMIDANKELDRVKKENTGNTLKATGSGAALGAAAGSIIPGLGTAAGAVIGGAIGLFTGLFGGASRKRKYREMLAKQNAKINALQDSSRFSAQTKAIQQMNAREYGDSEAQYLYGAKNGMLPEYSTGTPETKDLSNIQIVKPNEKLADSTFGKTKFFNSYASNGEVAAEDGIIRKLGEGKDNDDTLPFFATGKTSIFPNKGKEKYGMNISDYVWKTGDVNGGLLMLKDYKQNMNKNSMYAKNGRLPMYAGGKITFNPNDLIVNAATLADIKNSSSKKEDAFTSPLAIMKRNAIGASQQTIDNWKNSITPIDSKSPFGGLVDPYATNKRLKSPTGTENYGDDNYGNNGVGKWFTSPLDNLPYYFNMASALGHSLFRDRRIFTPKTGIAAPQGLDRLDALRMNPYPILINNRAAEARTNRAIDMSGGLNTAQRNLARLAAQYNTQLNDAKALANMQIQDNQYISDAVKTRLAAESAYDQRVVAQNNLRDDIFMRGHAANQKMDIDDLTTASTAWQQADKNTFNRNIYRWMMDQYAQENKANRKNRRWIV